MTPTPPRRLAPPPIRRGRRTDAGRQHVIDARLRERAQRDVDVAAAELDHRWRVEFIAAAREQPRSTIVARDGVRMLPEPTASLAIALADHEPSQATVDAARAHARAAARLARIDADAR